MTVTTQQAMTIGEAVHARALSYAAKTGTAIDLVVVGGADARETYKLTPVALRNAINANLSQEEIDALPLPGSRWNDGGEANNNCDIFQWKEGDGDSKPKEVSFYIVWADGTPEGSRVCTEIGYCKRSLSKDARTDDIPADWKAKYSNPKDITDRLKYLEGRRATIRNAYKEAVKLIWQMDLVNELATNGADGKPDGGGCVATIDGDGATILVEDKANPKKNWKFYSVGAFLRLNPKHASEQGGSYAALIATEKRNPKDKNKNNTGVPALNAVQTPETMDKVGLLLHSYLDKTLATTGSADYAALLRHLTGDTGKQSILTLGGIKEGIDKLFRMDAIRAVYDTEKAKLPKAA